MPPGGWPSPKRSALYAPVLIIIPLPELSTPRCIASIHGYTGDATADALASVMAGARASGFAATFITDRTIPNHYDGLPTLWKAELDVRRPVAR